MDHEEEQLVKSAGAFDVHRWSDHPEVNKVVRQLFDEMTLFRKTNDPNARIYDPLKIWRAIKVLVLDLYLAATQTPNPYRYISKGKGSYQKGTRYRKLFLKYDILVGTLNRLVGMGYVSVGAKGFQSHDTGTRRSTRIKATDKLLKLILAPENGIERFVTRNGCLALLQPNPNLDEQPELIRLKGEKSAKGYAELIDYKDADFPSADVMRQNLRQINSQLDASQIKLEISDAQKEAMFSQLNRKQRNAFRQPIDFSRNTLYSVVKDERFDHGGRFYGAWWQEVPRDYRKYIKINHKPTVELDYSGHHVRILYAQKGLQPPDDPYDIQGFDRDDQKVATLVLLNATGRIATEKGLIKKLVDDEIRHLEDAGNIFDKEQLVALRQEFTPWIRDRVLPLLPKIEERHEAIKDQFYSGVGTKLQFADSVVAEKILLQALKAGLTVLPVHDSFIVNMNWREELQSIMEEVFDAEFGKTAKIKPKPLRPDLQAREERTNQETNIIRLDICEYDSDEETYEWYYQLWGT